MTARRSTLVRDWAREVEARGRTSAPAGPLSGSARIPEPVAITGAAGCFPGAPDLATFWRHIDADAPQISEIPPDRFDWRLYQGGPDGGGMRTRWGGFIPDVAAFDPERFGMLPAEADETDPRLRLLLMAVWRALEDAGQDPNARGGPCTGVFVGCETNEYLGAMRRAGFEPKGLFEQADSMLGNRLSRFFDFTGPSEIVNTMCSGFAVALHRAVGALRAGEIDRAIVCAANVMLSPELFCALSSANQLSAGPTVKSFAEDADGYVRAEGAGAIVIEPMRQVEARGRFAYAAIRHVDVNHPGRGGASLSTPDIDAQAELVARCYRAARVDPRRIEYIEAQGMGIPVSDVAEWTALNRALGMLHREQGLPIEVGRCRLSTLKPLIGHMHAASGLGALLKVIRSFQTGRIHKVIGFDRPNAFCDMAGKPCRIVTETEDWPAGEHPRLAAFHSFGSGGNNAHVLLEEIAPDRCCAKPAIRSAEFRLRRCWFRTASPEAPDGSPGGLRDGSPGNAGAAKSAPRTGSPGRDRILEHIREAMGQHVERFDARRPFAELGVDSLSARILVGRLNEMLGLDRPPTDLFAYATPHALAGRLDTLMETPTMETPVPPRAVEPRPLRSDAAGAGCVTRPSAIRAAGNDIAVIGMSLRVAGARSPAEFWDNLRHGRSAITEIPVDRRSGHAAAVPNARGGFIDGVDAFDPRFFGISPREAAVMDPRHRLLLQAAHAAIEDAGYAPSSLSGSRAGIFLGLEDSDYPLSERSTITSAHTGTAPARIGYFLDLDGPVLSLNTACSSALVAAHYACKSLLSGESEIALAGGCNVFSDPAATWQALARMGDMLSPDGTCHAFDHRANGMVIGEGVGIVVLKRLADAEAAGDPIHGVIKASGINYDGRTNGLTAPSLLRQRALYQRVTADTGLTASRIEHVVAHGTGTALGDPIEFTALTEARGATPDGARPCALTSVKPTVGHSLAASGVVNLIAAIQSVRHAEIPPSINFEAPNRDLPPGSPFRVNVSLRAWQAKERFAGVSAFGHTGTNAHMIVANHETRPAPDPGGVHAIVVSGQGVDRLMAQLRRLGDWLDGPPGADAALADIAWTLQVGRDRMGERVGFVASSVAGLRVVLARLLNGEPTRGVFSSVSALASAAGEASGDDALGDTIRLDDTIRLSDTIRRWVAGEDVRWAALSGARGANRIHLPTYAFAEERYWIDAPGGEAPAMRSAAFAPDLPRDERVTRIVADYLQIPAERLDRSERLQTYGLDSLMLSGLIEAIRACFPDAEPAMLFSANSIDDLTLAVGATERSAPDDAAPKAHAPATAARRSVRCLKRSAAPLTRLIAFHPFGFGDESLAWMARLDDSIEVWCAGALGIQDWQELAETLADQIDPLFDLPVVFWGHSMGGIVAFEVLRRLEAHHGRRARQFVVSSAAAPELFARLKNSAPFLEIGPGSDPEAVAEHLVRSHYMPPPQSGLPALPVGDVLADVVLCQRYEASPATLVATPIFMVHANADVLVQDPAIVLEWQKTTTGPCRFETVEGTHMFFLRPPPGFINLLTLCCLENPFKITRFAPGAYQLRQVWSGTEDVHVYPLGAEPSGYLIYHPDGEMAAHLWHPLRAGGSSTAPADYMSYVAYGGPYAESRGRVGHEIAASLKVDLQDRRLVRFVEREGGLLTLQTSPVVDGSKGQLSASDYQKVSWELEPRRPASLPPELVGAWALSGHDGLPGGGGGAGDRAGLSLAGRCLVTGDGMISVIIHERDRPQMRRHNFALASDAEIERMLRGSVAWLGRLAPTVPGLCDISLLVRQSPGPMAIDRLIWSGTGSQLSLSWAGRSGGGPAFATVWDRVGAQT